MSRTTRKAGAEVSVRGVSPAGANRAIGASNPAEHWGRPQLAMCVLIVAAVAVVYQQVWHAGFIWDDDGHVVHSDLASLRGLFRIWFEPGATQQYYPFLYSAFWTQHQLWGESALGYHLVNVVLHACSACLLYRLLTRLMVPGAVLAAFVFAVHPVAVESVAWISEQKNTLSGFFYFSAALTYLSFDAQRRKRTYMLSLVLFALALASKTTTSTLPAALLVVFWWQRGKVDGRRDVLPLIPWFSLSVVAGTMTAWMEHTHVGATGAAYDLTGVERVLLAARALSFYAGKFLWPANLAFIYPRWDISASELQSWFFFFAIAAILGASFAVRGRMRGPLAIVLLFAGTLFPALGFVNVFPFLYSYVADHFQYLSLASAAAGGSALLTLGVSRTFPGLTAAARIGAALLVVALGILSWRQTAMFADKETLWRTTIIRNPQSWIAYNNLGHDLLLSGRLDEAIEKIEASLKIEPRNAAAFANLGNVWWRKGDVPRALDSYRRALAIDPANVPAHLNLGNALLQTGRAEEAIPHYQKVLEIKPEFATAHTNLGNAFLQLGRYDEAIAEYQVALRANSHEAEAQSNLGVVAGRRGKAEEAVANYRAALAIDPLFVAAHANLGLALLQLGRVDEALVHYRRVVELQPNSGKARRHLADALLRAGRTPEARVEYENALQRAPNDVEANTNLGTLLAQEGRLTDAVAHFKTALQADPKFAAANINLGHVQVQTGDYDEAIVSYQRALEVVPTSTAAQRGLEVARARKIQRKSAETLLNSFPGKN